MHVHALEERRESERGKVQNFGHFSLSYKRRLQKKNRLRGSGRITDGNLVNIELMEVALLGNLMRSELTLITNCCPSAHTSCAGVARPPNFTPPLLEKGPKLFYPPSQPSLHAEQFSHSLVVFGPYSIMLKNLSQRDASGEGRRI